MWKPRTESRTAYVMLGILEVIQGACRIASLGCWNPGIVAWFLFTYLD